MIAADASNKQNFPVILSMRKVQSNCRELWEDWSMNENGLWSLFWETGLPEAYLMLAALDREGPALPARTAFRPQPKEADRA